MAQAPDFRDRAEQASIYEMIGQSGKVYVFFLFPDSSVCVAGRVPTENRASARLDFTEVNVKAALEDCGIKEGTTYQRGQALLCSLGGHS